MYDVCWHYISLVPNGLVNRGTRGGYFVWVKGQEVKAFGKPGNEFTISKDKCLVPWWSQEP